MAVGKKYIWAQVGGGAGVENQWDFLVILFWPILKILSRVSDGFYAYMEMIGFQLLFLEQQLSPSTKITCNFEFWFEKLNNLILGGFYRKKSSSAHVSRFVSSLEQDGTFVLSLPARQGVLYRATHA